MSDDSKDMHNHLCAADIETARQLLGCGNPARTVAGVFRIPEHRLRKILGLPIFDQRQPRCLQRGVR